MDLMLSCLSVSPTVLWNLGNAYEQGGEIVNATKLFVECLSVREKSLPATHSHIIAGMSCLMQYGVVIYGSMYDVSPHPL